MVLPGKQQVAAATNLDELRESLLLRKRMGERELFIALAEIESRSGRPASALQILEEGMSGQEHRVSTWVQLARVKTRLGRLEEALQHYRHVLERLDPYNLPALRALAGAALATGAAERAQVYLERWYKITPDDPELEDFREEVVAMIDPVQESPDRDLPVPNRELLDMSLEELKPGYLSAPSPKDESAWSQEPRERALGVAVGKR